MATPPKEAPSSPMDNALKTGPPLVGVILNWWLFGLLFMQYLMYWNHVARRDGKFLRAIVHLLFLLDVAQTVMTMKDAFYWFVFNFGSYDALLHSGLSGIDAPVMDGIIAIIVQFVYCWRVWVLSKWRVFPITVAFLALGAGVSAMIVGISDAATDFGHDLGPNRFFTAVWVWLWGSVATDILIAGSMFYLLGFKAKGYSRNVKVVTKRLLILTLETNAATTVVAMTFAVLPHIGSLAPPFTNLHVVGGYTLGKLYSNCFMVLLNQRAYYDDASPDRGPPVEPGTSKTSGFTHSLRSGGTNLSSVGEVSTILFSPTTEFDDRTKKGDIELGQISGGMKSHA